MNAGILRSGETQSEVFPELQIIPLEQFQRVAKAREQRSVNYAIKCGWEPETVTGIKDRLLMLTSMFLLFCILWLCQANQRHHHLMVSDLSDPDHQASSLHLDGGSILRNGGHGPEDQSVKGIEVLAGQRDTKYLGHLLQGRLSTDLPGAGIHCLDQGKIASAYILLTQISHQLLHKIIDGDDTRHAAIYRNAI